MIKRKPIISGINPDQTKIWVQCADEAALKRLPKSITFGTFNSRYKLTGLDGKRTAIYSLVVRCPGLEEPKMTKRKPKEFEVEVRKEYIVIGTIRVEAGTQASAIAKVQRLMNDKKAPLQIDDPRIAWGDREYVDFSFDTTGETEAVEPTVPDYCPKCKFLLVEDGGHKKCPNCKREF